MDVTSADYSIVLPDKSVREIVRDGNYFRGKHRRSDFDEPTVLEDPARQETIAGIRSFYGVARISSMAENSVQDTCQEVSHGVIIKDCTFSKSDTVMCEWKLGLREREDEKIYATIVFNIEYEVVKDSKCVREKHYTVRAMTADLYDNTVNRSTIKNETVYFKYTSILKQFPIMEIGAILKSTPPAGTVEFTSSDCDKRCSCKCDLQLSNDPSVLFKALQLIHLGLRPVVDGDISNYAYTPDKNRAYKDFLLYWDWLYELDISDQSINLLSNGYLKKVQKLERLNLAYTGMEELPEGLHDLTNLKSLNLGGNMKLRTEHLLEALQPLNELKYLELSHVPLKHLDDLQGILNSMKLSTLILRDCHLHTINRDNLRHQTELVTLDISRNPLHSVSQDMVVDLIKLKTLRLSSNNLTSGPRLKTNTINLELLDLSNNRLSTIDDIISSGFVVELDLSRNQIQEWDHEHIFMSNGVPWVHTVNLAENKITLITDVMKKSLEQLGLVEMTNNPIDCADCRVLKGMRSWIINGNHKIHFRRVGDAPALSCGTPLRLVGFGVHTVKPPSSCDGWSSMILIGMLIPVALSICILALLVYCRWKFRYQLNRVENIIKQRTRNTKRGAFLHEKHFEYDIYLIYCPEDANFANRLKIRLEKCNRRYRILVPSKDIAAVSEEVRMSRHIVVVVTNRLLTAEYTREGIAKTNFWLLTGEYHNVIMLMMEGVNYAKLTPSITLLHTQYESINWLTSLPSDEKAFQKLLRLLGPSNHEVWYKALHQPLEMDQPPVRSKLNRCALMAKNTICSAITRNHKEANDEQNVDA